MTLVSADVELGAKIRASRIAASLTVHSLARAAGISASLISQAERGLASPSMATLRRISEALSVPVATLFTDDLDDGDGHAAFLRRNLLRRNQRRRLRSRPLYELLTPDENREIEFVWAEYEPGEFQNVTRGLQQGEVNAICLGGSLTLIMAESEYVLRKGDSIRFDRSDDHKWINRGRKRAWAALASARAPIAASATSKDELRKPPARRRVSSQSAWGDPDDLGGRIRELRQQSKLNLNQLAELTLTSPSLLSQIERGRASPSIASLRRIAAALRLPVSDLLQVQAGRRTEAKPENIETIIRPAYRKTLKIAGSDVIYELLSPDLNGRIEFVSAVFPPHAQLPNLMKHQGEEDVLCLKGSVHIVYGNDDCVLRRGDSVSYDSSAPHRAENQSDVPAVLLVAICPPSF